MNPDGPTAVAVTLVGGPCDGQLINVWPRGGGLMPYSLEALAHVDRGLAPPRIEDYHTYVRMGDARESRQYMYAKEVLRRAGQ